MVDSQESPAGLYGCAGYLGIPKARGAFLDRAMNTRDNEEGAHLSSNMRVFPLAAASEVRIHRAA